MGDQLSKATLLSGAWIFERIKT